MGQQYHLLQMWVSVLPSVLHLICQHISIKQHLLLVLTLRHPEDLLNLPQSSLNTLRIITPFEGRWVIPLKEI